MRLPLNFPYGELITEYLSNFLCFIVLSVEVFSVLFVCGMVESVVTVLFIDTIVLIGILIVGGIKMGIIPKKEPSAR